MSGVYRSLVGVDGTGGKTLEHQLASRLRAEREARGWSLGDLAAKSGISRAMASKIEREEASPTASLLGRMSAALGLTLSELFATKAAEPSQISRLKDQLAWQDPETGFTRRALSPTGHKQVDMTWCELPPGAKVDYPSGAFRAIDEQQLVLIDGLLTIWQGEQRFELHAQDSFRFDAPSATVFHNPGRRMSRYIVVTLRRHPVESLQAASAPRSSEKRAAKASRKAQLSA
jgi:transcriptional regulator with XRE-family HTH domain